MNQFEKNLDKYADLAIKVGVNIQPGQTLIINSDISSAPFVRLLAKKAYEVGAKLVQIEWSDEEVTRIRFDHACDESFSYYPNWRATMFEKAYEEGASLLSVVSSNPDLLKGVDVDKVAKYSKATGEATKNYLTYIMADNVCWSIVAVPSREWAAKVFPEVLSSEKQIEKLWEAIFSATRILQDDPIEAWNQHKSNLKSKVHYLNEQKFKALTYKAVGTDLTIELADNHLWVGPGSTSSTGIPFVANIPTEEVFTAPKKIGVNGIVSSSKPLNYGGSIIDQFSLTFQAGRIINFQAKKGYEALKKLVETDEGSHYLGEVALVPHDSPISNTNVIFYNTLFDENASHHLAIGRAYSFTIKGGKEMSETELAQNGANTSLTHVDFMIGTADMDIDGIKQDGSKVPLFRNGNWAL